MVEIAALGLKVSTDGVTQAVADLKKLTGAAGEAEAAAEKLAPAGKKAGTAAGEMGEKARKAATDTKTLGHESTTTEGALHRLASRAGTVAGTLVAMATAALSIGAYTRLADSWSDMQSVVGAATKDMDGAAGTMRRLSDLAAASYSPLEQTARGFAANATILKELGYTTDQMLNYTEALNHALVINAAKGENAAVVQNALGRALATGKLQATEYEVIMSRSPRVLEAIAKQMGVNVASLRQLGSEGQITGEIIGKSLTGELEKLRAEAADMPATVGDAFTLIGNSVLELVGVFDQTGQISTGLAEKLVELSKWIRSLAQTDFAAWGQAATDALTLLAQAVLVLAATRIPALIAATMALNASNVLMVAGFVAMRVQALAAAAATRTLGAAMALAGGPIGIVSAAVVGLGLAMYNQSAAAAAYRGAVEGAAKAQTTLNTAIDEFYRLNTRDAWAEAKAAAADRIAAIEQEIQASKDLLGAVQFRQNFGLWETSEQAGVAATIQALNVDLVEAQGILSALEHAASRFGEGVTGAATATAALTAEQEKALATADEMTRSYRDRAELARVEGQYGRESAQYLEAQLNQERAITFAKINALDITSQQKVAARQAYDLMVQQEAATKGWNVEIGRLSPPLQSAYDWLAKIRETQPGDGWLSTAISRASTLATTLWDAARANAAVSVSSSTGQTTGDGSWYAGQTASDLLPTARFGGLKDEPASAGSGGGGGGGTSVMDAMKDRLKALEENFASEYELAMQHYARDQETLKWALDNKKIALEQYNDYLEMLRIDTWGAEWEQAALQYEMDQQALQGALDNKLLSHEEYYRKLKELQWANLLSEDTRSDLAQDLSNYSQYFSQLYSMTGSSLDGLLKLQQGFSAASALMSAWEGYAKALKDGGATPWMRLMWAGKVLSAGLGAVRAIRGASSGGGSSSGGTASTGGATGGTTAAAAPEAPLRVSADAFDASQLYTGEAVQKWFDAIQSEAGNRGIVWVPV